MGKCPEIPQVESSMVTEKDTDFVNQTSMVANSFSKMIVTQLLETLPYYWNFKYSGCWVKSSSPSNYGPQIMNHQVSAGNWGLGARVIERAGFWGIPPWMESEWTVVFCLRWSRQAHPRERSICPRFSGQHGDGQRERSKNYVENQEDAGNELRAMNEGWRAEMSQWEKGPELRCWNFYECWPAGSGITQLNLNS